MSMTALLTAPKAFTDARVALIQTNALSSWRALGDVEIYLLGDEPGMQEAAARVGAVVLPTVRKNEQGTPIISSMVELVRQQSSSKLFCLLNADMIMLRDLVDAAMAVERLHERFVMLGRRWDLRVDQELEIGDGWEGEMRQMVQRLGHLHRPAGSDYFVFPRSCYSEIPDFAVGRAGWDNWMIYKARMAGWPVVDCTPSVTAIHQAHDYSHLPGGVTHHGVPETNENIRMAGGHGPIRYTILDATHVLTGGRLSRPAPSWARLLRGVEVLLRAVFSFMPAEQIEAIARPRRWKRRLRRLFGRPDKRPVLPEAEIDGTED